MKNLIHLYKNNPTTGLKDGTMVSEGDNSNPIETEALNATIAQEGKAIKVALRCDEGYKTTGNTVITPTGGTMDKWALALDNEGSSGEFGEYGASLILKDEIKDTNKIFWIKAKATTDELPKIDTSVKLTIQATITTN